MNGNTHRAPNELPPKVAWALKYKNKESLCWANWGIVYFLFNADAVGILILNDFTLIIEFRIRIPGKIFLFMNLIIICNVAWNRSARPSDQNFNILFLRNEFSKKFENILRVTWFTEIN